MQRARRVQLYFTLLQRTPASGLLFLFLQVIDAVLRWLALDEVEITVVFGNIHIIQCIHIGLCVFVLYGR